VVRNVSVPISREDITGIVHQRLHGQRQVDGYQYVFDSIGDGYLGDTDNAGNAGLVGFLTFGINRRSM